jgi:GNAT superfamily N-acetyltransferase
MDGELVAYAVYVPSTGRVKQCAVHPHWRRKGLGSSLIAHMMDHNEKGALVFTNVDEAYTAGIQFLEVLGFKKFLGLYEMKLQVPGNKKINHANQMYPVNKLS